MQKKLHSNLKILLAGLALLLAPSAAPADWVGHIDASIAFPFMIGDEELPAGDYVLSTMRSEPNVLKIRRIDEPATEEPTVILTTPYESEAMAEAPAEPELVFEQFGGKSYLSVVRVPRRSMAWRVEVPDELAARLESGESTKTSVEGREGD